jgi:hypothetical protein
MVSILNHWNDLPERKKAKDRTEVFSESDVEHFHGGEGDFLYRGLLFLALDISDGYTVGGHVAGFLEPIHLDEDLDEDGSKVLVHLPVVQKASCRHANDFVVVRCNWLG